MNAVHPDNVMHTKARTYPTALAFFPPWPGTPPFHSQQCQKLYHSRPCYMVRLAESDSLVLEGPSILFEDLPPFRGHDQGCFRGPTGRWWQHGRSRLTVSHAVLRGTHICKALPVSMYGSDCNSAEGLLHCLLQQTASMSGPSPPAAYGLGPISCF